MFVSLITIFVTVLLLRTSKNLSFFANRSYTTSLPLVTEEFGRGRTVMTGEVDGRGRGLTFRLWGDCDLG